MRKGFQILTTYRAREKTMPKQNEKDHLSSRLPPELRNAIYELALPSDRVVKLDDEEPALLRTSKQIRQQASKMFYSGKQLRATGDGRRLHFEAQIRKLERIINDCGLTRSVSLSIQITNDCKAMALLVSLKPLLDLMRVTGFEPATEKYRGYEFSRTGTGLQVTVASVFELPSGSRWSLDRIFSDPCREAREALEGALTLARTARKEGWTSVELETAHTKFAWSMLTATLLLGP